MTSRFCIGLVLVLASNLRAHAQQKDPPKNFTNAIGMKFVWISPGTFIMGSPMEEAGRDPEEVQHKVTLTRGFYMGVNLVTQEQWKEVMGNNPSEFKSEKNLPVENVSWDDCQAFIKKLREKDKKPYRLPSEAEWEYACRAGTKTAYHFGNDKSILGQFAWYRDNSEKKTHPVGSKKPNEWGLFDMHGNVWQWCQDWNYFYSKEDTVDPQGTEKKLNFKVMRGGSWFFDPSHCRSAKRRVHGPNFRHNHIGFRICFFNE